MVLKPVPLVATHPVKAKRATPLRHASGATLGGQRRRCCVAKLSRIAHASRRAPDLRPAARAQVESAALSGRSRLGPLPHGWCEAASDRQAPAWAVLGVGRAITGPTDRSLPATLSLRCARPALGKTTRRSLGSTRRRAGIAAGSRPGRHHRWFPAREPCGDGTSRTRWSPKRARIGPQPAASSVAGYSKKTRFCRPFDTTHG
jgi:hypothetical protein